MSDGSFTWDICQAIGNGADYTIQVGWADCEPSVAAFSAAFSIADSSPRPTLTLTSPIGGETWVAGTPRTITWDSTNGTGSVDLGVYRPDWGWWWIGDTPMSAGTFVWPVSPYLGDGADYAISVEWWGCGPGVSGSSPYFAITGSHQPGDCDGDGDVDLTDYSILQGCLGGPLVFARSDYSGDGDVDLVDFTGWERCLDGPAVPPSSQCILMDLDGDNDVDVGDFALFARDFTGAEYPLPPGCEAADFDIDRDVDLYDFAMFQEAFGL